jgi:MFS family permease
VPRRPGALREGLAYVRRRRELLLVIVLAGVVGTFGFNFQITTALMATKVFHSGPSAFGLLSTAFAAGSLAGALLSARRAGNTGSRPGLRLVVALSLAFGVLESVAGLAPSYATFFAILIPTGLFAIAFSTTANAFVQLGAEPQLRGRVLAIYMLAFFGGTPIGSPLLGWIAEVAGTRWALVGSGLAVLAFTVLAVMWLRPRGPGAQADAADTSADTSADTAARNAVDGRVDA